MTEADATESVAVRQNWKADVAGSWGFAPGNDGLLARIVAAVLVKLPQAGIAEQQHHKEIGS